MASILNEIQDYVHNLGLAIVGDDSYASSMPADVPRGVLFRLPLNGVPIDPELPGYRKTSIQVIVRDASREEGEERCLILMDALTMNETFLENFKITYMRPRHDPIDYPRSGSGYVEFSVNYDVRYFRI